MLNIGGDTCIINYFKIVDSRNNRNGSSCHCGPP